MQKAYTLCTYISFIIIYYSYMTRLKTNAKRKLNKALFRVEKVVIMDVRKNLEQQKKRKAKVMNKKAK